MARTWGSLWTAVIVVATLIGAAIVIALLLGGARQNTVRRGWERTLGTPADVFAAHPARGPNEAALALERAAAELGIDIVPRHRRAQLRRPPPVGSPSRERMGALRGWIGDELGDARLVVDEPRPGVAEWLDEIAEPLSRVRAALREDDPPRWTRELEQLLGAPVPNLLGLIELNAVLVADALLHVRRGDDDTARRDLEAAWVLGSSLLDEVEQIVNLVGINVVRRVAGALRFVDDVPIDWSGRLRSLDARGAIVRSMRIEAWVWSQGDAFVLGDAQDNPIEQLLKSIARPYTVASMADLSERLRVRIERLAEADPRCDADLDALGVGLDVKLPRWSLAASAYGPGVFGGTVERANRLELDLELTARLVELRAARRASGGRWSAALPPPRESWACPGDRWRYEPGQGGALRLALERQPVWREVPPRNRGVLPVEAIVVP